MLSDCRIPTKMKEKFYKIVIRLAINYEAQCWPIRIQYMLSECSRDQNVEMNV